MTMQDPNETYASVESNIAKTMLKNVHSLPALPPKKPPKGFEDILKKRTTPELDLVHGTILGFKYQGGIVMCSSSTQMTMNDFGMQKTPKIVTLDPCLLGTMTGCGADCNYWYREVIRQCRLYRLYNENRSMPVSSAAKFVHRIMLDLMRTDLCMGMILAGFDPDGPKLFYIDNKGAHIQGNVFAIGSGRQYALRLFDNHYSWDISDETACNLARRAINTNKLIHVYYMNNDGYRYFTRDNDSEQIQFQDEPMDIEV